ncbi:MAG: type II secretion system F family protein [candidate division WOR-3 bacterium]
MIKTIAYVTFFLFVILIVIYIYRFIRSYRERFLKQTADEIEVLYLGLRAEQLWIIQVVGVIFVAILLLIISGFNIIGAVIGAVIGFFIPRIFIQQQKAKRLKKFDNQLVDAITLIANSLKAGLNLNQAVEMVTKEMGPPISQEFSFALKENRLGTSMETAMANMLQRVRSDDLEIVINAMNIALETGGILSEVFIKIADTIRERNRIKGKLDALTAQGKLQGIIMTLLPWGLAGILYIIEPTMVKPMFTEQLGQILLGAVVVLEILGWFFIRKIMKIDI